jgi:hypothetical protein
MSKQEPTVVLVYVCAFAPESALELSGKLPGSTLSQALNAYPITPGGSELAIRPDAFHHQFAADVPAAQAGLNIPVALHRFMADRAGADAGSPPVPPGIPPACRQPGLTAQRHWALAGPGLWAGPRGLATRRGGR